MEYIEQKYNIFLIVIVIIIIVYMFNKIEGFKPTYGEPLEYDMYNNIWGYKTIKSLPKEIEQQQMKLLREDRLKSLMWETRFPGLVRQRYSFNDRRCNKNNISLGYNSPALLCELPINFKVNYNAVAYLHS